MSWNKEQNVLSLLDEEFLTVLLEQQERVLYARLSSLDINELPIERIEGRVTGGNINIDGDSCVRRTCSVTMIANDVNIQDYYWGLNTKFKLEIGVTNTINNPQYSAAASDYPDIVWFPCGIYFISSFNTSLQVNGFTISVTGKDKMCMLNGDLGGQLFASIDFGTEEYQQTVMRLANTSGISSSEQLMLNKYYMLIVQPQEDNILIDRVYDENNKQVPYKFVEDNNGKYYKFNNIYKLITSTFNNNNYQGTKYTCYKLVTEPNQLFENVQNGSSPKGSYYIKNNVYVLDTVGGQSTSYYELKDLYEIDYEYTKQQIPLEKIIRESIHTYAKEPYHNIIINDLDKYGLEQITYKGDIPLLAFRDANTGHFVNIAYADQFLHAYQSLGLSLSATNSSINTNGFNLDNLSSNPNDEVTKVVFYKVLNSNIRGYAREGSTLPEGAEIYRTYSIAPIYYGMDIGYRIVDLVYTGELISSIGETLTSVLDKIKNMLGDFEYFYDTDGRFVFQKKRTYVNTAWSQFVSNEDEQYVTYSNEHSKFSFNFEGNRLITAIQNTPVLTNLKNDYIVWGKRQSLSGADVPIHARYAIDRRPTEYMAFNGTLYITKDAIYNPSNQWRELIVGTSSVLDGYSKNIDIIPQSLIDADPAVATLPDNEKRQNTLWYEIMDWAEKYYLLTGAYPKQYMKEYEQNGGFKGSITFADQHTETFPSSGQLIIDFNTLGPNGETLNVYQMIPYYRAGPFQHRYNGCWHTYQEFLRRYNTYPGMRSFIYDPQMPTEEVIHQDGGSLNNDLKDVLSIINKEKIVVDWRELIYQMAMDYFAGQGCDETHPIYDKTGKLILDNPDNFLYMVGILNRDKYPSGYTGYEQYYTDMQGFWRQLYNPYYQPQFVYDTGKYNINITKAQNSNFYTKTKQWNDVHLTDINIEYYSLEDTIKNRNNVNINVIYKFNDGYHQTNNSSSTLITTFLSNILYKVGNRLYRANDSNNDLVLINNSEYFVDENSSRLYWNVNVFKNPELLNFWLDFLDEGEELSQFGISQVGDRQKVINDDKISAIIFKEIPDLILYEKRVFNAEQGGYGPDTQIDYREAYEEQTGYTWIYLPQGFSRYLNISYRSLSAKDKIDELLYQYSYCIENISITALPIYHLQPNTRIYVCDKNTGINGEYIVNKISLPLTYNGIMSITASLAPQRIL